MPNSRFRNSSSGTDKLAQDIAKLFNDHRGSDVQFKVGGGATDKSLQPTGETIIDTSTAVTLHAHTAILRCRSRYFAAMFENDKEWKERSGGVIYKPNTSLAVFYKILQYIYTGDVHVQKDILLEVITAAEEMELEELSIACQTNVMELLEQAVLKEENHIERNKSSYNEAEESRYQSLSISVAVRRFLIPALILAHNHTMSDFFRQIFDFTVGHIGVILTSTDTRTAFIEIIPPQIFRQILASDSLKLQEYDIWKLAFKYACHKTKVLETAVEAYFKLESNDYEGSKSDGEDSKLLALLSDEQLKQLRTNLTPLLSAIRFSLMKSNQYSRIVDILNYFLHSRRLIELQRFYMNSEKTQPLDLPRLYGQEMSLLSTEEVDRDPQVFSKIIDKMESWQQMKTWILESDGLEGRHSTEDMKFNLLFRASEHEFSMKACHEHCDNKGPTILIVKSDDGHIFGGVNFASWEAGNIFGNFSGTTSNFLFSLPDSHHRKTSAIFPYDEKSDNITATHNRKDRLDFGDGDSDLKIVDKANTAKSCSHMPLSYNGVGASETALAGKAEFLVAEYEVFAIS